VRPHLGSHRLDRLTPANVQVMVNTLAAGERDPAKRDTW